MSFIFSRALDSGTKQKIMAGGVISSLLAVSLVVSLGILGGIIRLPSGPDIGPVSEVFTINHTVATNFADFIPYDETFEANAPQYSVSPGLANIANLQSFPTLTTSQKQLIETNGFVAIPQSEYKQIHEILDENKDDKIPSFVSSDAVLHAFHILYDLALREAEVYSFWDLLGNLTASMLDSSFTQYQEAPTGRWKDAALRNMMFFTVALKLIDNETIIPVEFPDEVATAVERTLQLIDAHEEMTNQWFMGYKEDFTQFVPRGHYTRSELLGRYFKAMMLYGRVNFLLQPELPDVPNEKGMNYTAQAILISLALQEEISTLPEGTTGYDVWDAIYQPTVFFVGAADDLLPTEYLSLMTDIYGESFSWDDLNDDELLEQFIDAAMSFRDPLILGHPVPDFKSMNHTKGLRFMGQRYIPDSYILGQLVYKYVGTMGNPRLMPMGLDVMAALGSERAWELLDDQKQYYNYVEQMEKMWQMVGNITIEEWTKNLYYLWLYSLLPLLEDPGEGYPFFMQSDAWVDKQLMTALGSWTELRHDTILYAKQSYTWELTGIIEPPQGYVEPVPRVYARLASLCRMMISGLDKRSLLSDWIEQRLTKLHDFLRTLQSISIKELSGVQLNETEIKTIENSGEILATIVERPTDEALTSDADDNMAVVADVHTDPNDRKVLEEAVGDPMVIYVAVYVEDQVILARGGIFSYYEFTWPMDDRLTDEAWQDLLDAGEEPAMPSWTESFVSIDTMPGFHLLAFTTKKEDE